MVSINFDEIDSKIICMLQEDGRRPFTSIAKELGIAESTARARTQRLIKDGIIQIVAISDPKKLGYEVYGNMKLIIDLRKVKKIIEQLQCLQQVTYIALLTGDADIDLDFIVNDMEDLTKFVYEHIANIDGIIQTRTSLIMGFEKYTYTHKTILEKQKKR